MNWKKALTTVLIVATVVLFVIATRQNDTNVELKTQLGIQYEQKVQNFRNYVQDMQSANDSGEALNTNHFYSEMTSFPIKNQHLTVQMNELYDELSGFSNGKAIPSEERKQLGDDLNDLQLNLIALMSIPSEDPLDWYTMVNDPTSKQAKEIDKIYEK